jgi:outer membrane protein OmpA-like peptidoglycan-associated protein
VLDNVYPKGKGHTLKLHYHKPGQPTQQTQQQTVVVAEKTALSVTVVDKETGQLVKASAKIFNKKLLKGPPVGTFDSITSFTSSLDANTSYILKVEANNYFDFSKEIRTLTTPENLTIRAEMNRIVVGRNVVFENILFYGNEASFLPESTPVLESLLGTMKKNPKLKIEIQGHVNCPTSWESCQTNKMQEFNMALSINRAKAVYEYLMESGVDPVRMTYKGFGATRMIYPDARSEDKMEKNRRVEIVVVSN